jgi:hypothetical protein
VRLFTNFDEEVQRIPMNSSDIQAICRELDEKGFLAARLYEKVDPSLPSHLYSKWNVKEVFEGTGKKPRDLDPTLSSAEIIREVQS